MIQRGFTLWFTGRSGSGKTSISNMVHHRLQGSGITNVELLDGDVVGVHLSGSRGFTREDRDTHVRRIGWVAQLLTKHKVPNMVAAISPYRSERDEVRRLVEHAGGPGSFIEVYVDCPEEICAERRKDAADTPGGPPGSEGSYEPPHGPEVHVRTGEQGVEESAEEVIAFLKEKGFVEL